MSVLDFVTVCFHLSLDIQVVTYLCDASTLGPCHAWGYNRGKFRATGTFLKTDEHAGKYTDRQERPCEAN
jgi:hypothetical protein